MNDNSQKQILEAASSFDLTRLKKFLEENKTPTSRVAPEFLKARLKHQSYYTVALILKTEQAFLDYEKTGIISEDLLPFFDQEGNWYGFGKNAGVELLKPYKNLMKEKIPKEKLLKKDSLGNLHLLSSFYTENSSELGFGELTGEITGEPSPTLFAEIETKLGEENDNNYTSIAGDLNAPYAATATIPRVLKIGGRLSLRGCRKLYAPELRSIGWYADLSSLEEINLPKLRYVGEWLNAKLANKIELTNLEQVLGHLGLEQIQHRKIKENDRKILQSRLTYSLPKLREVWGTLKLPNLHSLKTWQLKKIAKTCQDKESFINLCEELTRREKIRRILSQDTTGLSKDLTLNFD